MNCRFIHQSITGVQRYGHELLKRLSDRVEPVQPKIRKTGLLAHSWEQYTLPRIVRDRLLWSPGNSGPLSVSNQIVTLHDVSTLDHPEWYAKSFALAYQLLLPKLSQRVRKIITVSQFSKQRIVEKLQVSPEKISVVPNGVSRHFRPATQESVEAFRSKKGLNRPSLVYLGSLAPRKNLLNLLEAWRQVGHSPAELVIVGDANHIFGRTQIKNIPPHVRFVGRATEAELPVLFSGALGFVFPSQYEGFGLPVLEAMACGCPVLVSETTSVPEICGSTFDLSTGMGVALYFDPSSPENITEKLNLILQMSSADRDRMKHNGRSRSSQFTWEKTAELTWNVLQEQ